MATTTSKREEVPNAAYDVVALVASAGGFRVINEILSNLPRPFPVPIIVMQHLAPQQQSEMAETLARTTKHKTRWAEEHLPLEPGEIVVCPAGKKLAILPDRTCVVTPCMRGAIERPFDFLFKSLAKSFGPRSLVAVLTGMGDDGSAGALNVKHAGGKVLVQGVESAEYPSMPEAAIRVGAADLVIPLEDLGDLIWNLVTGSPHSKPNSEIRAIQTVFGVQGEIAELAWEIDWQRTSLGPVRQWPLVLCSSVRLAVDTCQPVCVLWGPENYLLPNDAAVPLLGGRLQDVIARPVLESFPAMGEFLRPLIARVVNGESMKDRARLVPLDYGGRPHDAWFNLTLTPLRDPLGKVCGLYLQWSDRTSEVLAARRLQALNRLAAATTSRGAREAMILFSQALHDLPDVPFAITYELDRQGEQANLVGTVGIEAGGAVAPRSIHVKDNEDTWPLQKIMAGARPETIYGIADRFERDSIGATHMSVDQAICFPIRDEVDDTTAGILILGVNPRTPLDRLYHEFLALAADTISRHVAEARARERERERLNQLAEIDRIKTEFFSNVSHEFRTPLTLLLAPVEEILRRPGELPETIEDLDVVARNARRLLSLVNHLLDFSKIEADQARKPSYEEANLSLLTTDLVSTFRSAVESAGLKLRVHCDEELTSVWIDRHMWEIVVSNLLANAFKFTFDGQISVTLRRLRMHAELVVSDTGVGIPHDELPNLFKRFHRVRGTRARTAEGAGIGLSVVHDLVERMAGTIQVRSKEGTGSSFTIWVPLKPIRLKGGAPGRI